MKTRIAVVCVLVGLTGCRQEPTPLSPASSDLAGTVPSDGGEGSTDAPDMEGRLLGCASILRCNNECFGEPTCQHECPYIGTLRAKVVFAEILRCMFGDPQAGIAGVCENFGGGVCDVHAPGFDLGLCAQCESDSMLPGQPCYGKLLDCQRDCVLDFECESDPPSRCVDHACQPR